MQVFVQLLITGVAMGFIYALVGIEYTLIWNSTGLLNFSHDKFILFGAYMFAGSYVLSLGLPPVLAILCTVLTMFLLGMVSAFAIFNPLSKLSTNLFTVIGTVILGRIITECVRLIWGPLPFTLDNFLRGSFHLGPIVVSKAHIVIIVVCSIITAGLQIFFKTTKMGKAMRCVSENKTAASLMGINVPMNIAFTVGLSALICATIGVLVIPIFNVELQMSSMIGLKGFASGVIGGFGYLPGAIVGGILLGVVEIFGSMIIPSVYKDCLSFVLLIIFLLIKPSGILGNRR